MAKKKQWPNNRAQAEPTNWPQQTNIANAIAAGMRFRFPNEKQLFVFWCLPTQMVSEALILFASLEFGVTALCSQVSNE